MVLCCRTLRQASSTGCCCIRLGIEQRAPTCVLCETRKPSFYLISFLLFFLPQVSSVYSHPVTHSFGPSCLHPISMPDPWGTPFLVHHLAVLGCDDPGQCHGIGNLQFYCSVVTNRNGKLGKKKINLKLVVQKYF